MAVIAGDLIEVTYNHPELGSGTIFPKAGESTTLNTGGFFSTDEANGVDGGGNLIVTMQRNVSSASFTAAWDNNVRKDLEALTALAAHPVDADWTLTHVSGIVYGGKMRPVGALEGDMGAATIAVKLAGGNKLKQL